MTAHDLAADWSWQNDAVGFRVKGGRVVWQDAEYLEGVGRLMISRLDTSGGNLVPRARLVDPETPVDLVRATA